jgi:5'-3' exonuclease
MNVPTSKYVKYFMNRVQELLAAGIVPVLVFDGGKLPAKVDEEESRQKKRTHSLAIASNLMREGNRTAAAEHFAKAVDVTPQLAHTVQAAAALIGVEILVAPYEADAQLAFLSLNGFVDAVISEDSDLLVYGCPEVLFKFDSASGMCERILQRDVAGCLGFPANANCDFLKHVALLNGCDYCPGVNNVGIKKAIDLLRELGGDSLVAVNTLRSQGFWIDNKDVQLMRLGILTYKHQVVYNPTIKRLQHLTPMPPSAAVADASFLGLIYDDTAAVDVATGKLDPMTKVPFHSIDEPCTCARQLAFPIASNSDPALNSGALKRPRISLPSSSAPLPQVLPSVLSFFKATSNLPVPLPKLSPAAELDTAPVAESPKSPVVQARSKYFAATVAGGSEIRIPFSARGGACGSLFKIINRGSSDASVNEEPSVRMNSPKNGELFLLYSRLTLGSLIPLFSAIERLKQYRYHKDENTNLTRTPSSGSAPCVRCIPCSAAIHCLSAVTDESPPCRTPSPTPASSQAVAPSQSFATVTPQQRLQAFAYNPSVQHAAQPLGYKPSARASGLKKTTPAIALSKSLSR